MTGIVSGWDATDVTLRLWRRDGTAWRADGPAWPASLGHAGAAWGRGLHGNGAPAGNDGPAKAEGDGRSPAGVFALTAAYGYGPRGRGALPYTPVDAAWHCIDDGASRHYDRILDDRTVTADWRSAEDMRRRDDLYRWVIRIAHNPAREPGAGSCIFFHLWHRPGAVTAGCTAMARPAMERLLDALDPADQPVYLLLPAATYDALATSWALPPR